MGAGDGRSGTILEGFRQGPPADVVGKGAAGPRGPGGWGARAGGGYAAIAWQIGLPTIDRPPSAIDFNIDGTLAGRTSVNTPVAFPTSFQLPPNNVGAIKSITILANTLLVTSNIRWRLRFNQQFVVGWNNLTINPRAAGSVELSFTPDETAIPVPEGALVDMVVQVLDAGTYQVSFGLHGWFYSTALGGAASSAWGGA